LTKKRIFEHTLNCFKRFVYSIKSMKYIFRKYSPIFFLILLFSKNSLAQEKISEPQNTVRFTENKGQWENQVLYRAQLDGGVLFFEKNCFTYNFYDKETLRENHIPKHSQTSKQEKPLGTENQTQQKIAPIASHAFRMTFVNANNSVITTANHVTPDYCNYFIGNDKRKWAGNVKNYKEINYYNLYDGINMQVLGLPNSLKYNFFVAPGVETKKIKLFYEGLNSIVLKNGALKLTTSLNEIVEQQPYAYQWIGNKRIDVPCEFVLENTTVSFRFPHGYEKGYELVIDPVLVFAATSGSLADNFGMTATYDSHGNLYSGGTAFGQGYPTTFGAFDTTYNGIVQDGRTDVVITKYDSTGTFLHYSTYIGGAVGTEIVTSLVVNAQDELLLYGATGSSDFSITSNAYDSTFNGGDSMNFVFNGTMFNKGTDIFVAKLNATGSSLLASTFIGGSLNDGVNRNNQKVVWCCINSNPFLEYPLDSLQYNYGDQYRGEINIDKYGDVYIVSSSRSPDFPIVNGFDSTLGGQQDAVLFKFNCGLSQLKWSTYIGGSGNDAGYALALDDSANVYITGGTLSVDFPSTLGALNTQYNGGKADGYVTKIKKDGTHILFSTFLGTKEYDQTYFVQLDKKNDVYVVGQTEGAMPVTAGVYSNPNSGQFITKINDSLNTLIFSTNFGNGDTMPNISPAAFLVDYCENIYVSGWGGNIIGGPPTFNMPLTANAYQSTNPDGFNFYLFVLSKDAKSLLYATYFGGAQSEEHVDGGTSRFDKKGIVYQSVCANCGGSKPSNRREDFPVTPGAWPNTGANVNHNTQNYNCNNGVFKLDFQIPLVQANFTVSNVAGCAPLTVTFKNQSSPGASFKWDFGKGDTTSKVVNPIRTFTNPGTYLVKMYVVNPLACNVVDTTYQYINVHPSITSDFDFDTQPCSNKVMFLDSSAIAPISWLWHFDDGDSSTVQNPIHIYKSIGVYNVQLISANLNGCKDTSIVQVDFKTPPVSINKDVTICKNNPTQLSASGGASYNWLPNTGLNNANIANPIANPANTTTYTVSIAFVNTFGDSCIQQLTTTVKVIDPALYTITASADKDTLLQGQSTTIRVHTDSTLLVHWQASSGVNLPPYFNVPVEPETSTTYTVSILENVAGCAESALVSIFIHPKECDAANVFVPNTFTPNGDGKNDVLFVRGNLITELYFAVYNRWGQLVFETTDINKGWSGIYNNMKADPAVFAWYLKAKCFNGETLEKKGNVTLIR
jgi:gliding motility-associated-like protein